MARTELSCCATLLGIRVCRRSADLRVRTHQCGGGAAAGCLGGRRTTLRRGVAAVENQIRLRWTVSGITACDVQLLPRSGTARAAQASADPLDLTESRRLTTSFVSQLRPAGTAETLRPGSATEASLTILWVYILRRHGMLRRELGFGGHLP